LATAARYLSLGIEHILLGWDHLAFVLALCLLATRRELVKLVSAFTLGHSVTLALAALGWLAIPAPPIEACIALSIVYVARQALLPRAALHHGVGIVLCFGLLHGLGFASALRESGIERGELLLGLLSFNLGVEIGQLGFVLAFLLLAAGLRQPLTRRLVPATAFGLGSLGIYWTLERIAGFL
jgi:hydrogenase/urease accessory protein HupE